jgi:uroporphyrinogen-III synthase
MPFAGLRVLSLESRRAAEIETLIRAQNGVPLVAPSMREVPLGENPQALAFAERLFHGEFDIVILLTGVGARYLNQLIESRWPPGAFADALRSVSVIVRGPKPMAVMREWAVPVAALAPEPNTWHEVLAVMPPDIAGKQIAVQEFGRPSTELIDALAARGAAVASVPVYQWDLPLDLAPLRDAARRLAAGEIDVVLLTTGVQIQHLLRVAAEMNLETAVGSQLKHTMLASIGPSTSEALADLGLRPDFEPSHPKMGILVREAAAQAHRILQSKQ